MREKRRDFFPGGNTPKGFHSYYQYIAGQKESEAIICIKGGPGTGKSTFMKSVAEHFLNKGEEVDCFWCSSDPDSLDAILLRQRHIALMDGTSPHVIDPQNPGAVDTILHLGDFWDNIGIKENKDCILKSGSIIKSWFECAYANLKAAAVLREQIRRLYKDNTYGGELYKLTTGIIDKELTGKSVTIAEGKCRKYFASAITYKGNLTHMKSLVRDYRKLYLFAAPVGFDMKHTMQMISENYVHRGYCIEQFYCPMGPDDRIEHVLIPELELGFMTLNDYHDLEICGCTADITNIDMREYLDWNSIEKYSGVIHNCEEESSRLTEAAISYLQKAKQEHDVLEGYYVPNMNFEKIKTLTDEWICKIERNKV